MCLFEATFTTDSVVRLKGGIAAIVQNIAEAKLLENSPRSSGTLEVQGQEGVRWFASPLRPTEHEVLPFSQGGQCALVL